jgi:hypothetical protein
VRRLRTSFRLRMMACDSDVVYLDDIAMTWGAERGGALAIGRPDPDRVSTADDEVFQLL